MMNIPLEFIFFYLIMFIFGAVFGSFACCQAWRSHEKPKKLGSRSICMHCKTKLKWHDNIPILSWLLLRGKCRNCKKKIGNAEILAELSLGLAFLALSIHFTSGFLHDGGLVSFLGFLAQNLVFTASLLILFIASIMYWILLIYDAKWGELPVILMISEIPLAILYQILNHGDFLQIGASIAILAGIYYLLYFISKEKWVGGGDWILCVSIAIFLGRFELAIFELFLANTFASVYAIPSAILKKERKIPFGPFLILGLIILLLFKDFILRFTFYF